jgi:hypothetical protein
MEPTAKQSKVLNPYVPKLFSLACDITDRMDSANEWLQCGNLRGLKDSLTISCSTPLMIMSLRYVITVFKRTDY